MKEIKNEEMAAKIIMPSEAYQLMLAGKQEDAVRVLLSDNDGSKMLSFVKKTEEALQAHKEHANEVKDRSFWKKLFSNNTKDLADVLCDQNIIMSSFFIMLRLQNISGEACSRMLSELYKYAENEANTTGTENKNIQQAIISTLERNQEEYLANQLRDKALMKLLKLTDQIYKEQTNKANISDLEKKADKSLTYTKNEVNALLSKKQNTIIDIGTIRKNAAKGAAAVQPCDISKWAKAKEKPTYTAEEVGALPSSTKIPTKVSELDNDNKFLTEHQDISSKANQEDVTNKLSNKVDSATYEKEVTSFSNKLATNQKITITSLVIGGLSFIGMVALIAKFIFFAM